MKRNQMIAIIVGFLIIFVVALLIVTNQESEDIAPKSSTPIEMMDDDAAVVDDNPYATLTGEEFDKAYIADMMAHHAGAINMAEMISGATDRPELNQLGQDIMRTQTEEMMQMQAWQTEWGYDSTGGGHGSHSGAANDMAGHMNAMGEELVELRGSAFEKRFLELMIEHHQQAIDMSKYAEKNAHHQELKDLAKGVIVEQEREIKQMKQWLKDWGYKTTANANSDSHSSH